MVPQKLSQFGGVQNQKAAEYSSLVIMFMLAQTIANDRHERASINGGSSVHRHITPSAGEKLQHDKSRFSTEAPCHLGKKHEQME